MQATLFIRHQYRTLLKACMMAYMIWKEFFRMTTANLLHQLTYFESSHLLLERQSVNSSFHTAKEHKLYCKDMDLHLMRT